MSDYRILVKRSPRRIKQRFHVTVVDAGNGRTLLHSENLRDLSYARRLAQRLTHDLDGIFIDAS